MWSDEQVQDAVAVLWNASELGPIQKVKSTDDKISAKIISSLETSPIQIRFI